MASSNISQAGSRLVSSRISVSAVSSVSSSLVSESPESLSEGFSSESEPSLWWRSVVVCLSVAPSRPCVSSNSFFHFRHSAVDFHSSQARVQWLRRVHSQVPGFQLYSASFGILGLGRGRLPALRPSAWRYCILPCLLAGHWGSPKFDGCSGGPSCGESGVVEVSLNLRPVPCCCLALAAYSLLVSPWLWPFLLGVSSEVASLWMLPQGVILSLSGGQVQQPSLESCSI